MPRSAPCSICGSRTDVRRVALVDRGTGRPGELVLCGLCRVEPDRVWRQRWRIAPGESTMEKAAR